MRSTLLLSTALGAALLAVPALAQSGADYGFRPPPGTPMTPSNQGGAGLIPPVRQQDQAARMAEGAPREAQVLLRDAERALARNNGGLANEYLERAETVILNRRALAGLDSTAAMRDRDPVRHISEAREALRNRDIAGARQAVQMAMSEAGRMGSPDYATGAGAGAAPMQGGGGGGGRGMSGNYAPTQAQPQGGLGTPGGASPYGAAQGTETMPNPVQPGSSALGNVQGQAAAPRGAPPPGQPFPQAGGQSSQMSTTGQIRPGSPTAGGGTGGSQR